MEEFINTTTPGHHQDHDIATAEAIRPKLLTPKEMSKVPITEIGRNGNDEATDGCRRRKDTKKKL